MTASPSKKQLSDSLTERNPSVDWRARFTPSRRLIGLFERISLAFEKPLNWLINDPRFNPLYHTGTITIFLLIVILLTGIYLTMFYPFGFTFSYLAVSKIEANFIGRIIRALHRYASDAAVIFALLHGWRTFFQDRFRGPRWLAWVTGVGMAFVVWGIGITGYWLIWDNRAQILNESLFDILGTFAGGKKFLVDYIVGEAAGTGWIFMMIMIVLHLGLSALVALFLWWHLQRMSRAKWTPPKYWMAVSIAVLLVAALLFPVGMLPPINPSVLPTQTPTDLFFLFYLSTFLRGPQALFWAVLLAVLAAALALPWLMPRAKELKPVQVSLPACDGCTLCERDCPYTAIKMVPRTDGAHHKFQAEIDPQLCVSCGVCIGSCPENALTFGDLPLDPFWQTTLKQVSEQQKTKVIFTCERHAMQGALNAEGPDTYIIPMTCIAMANPKLAAQAIEAGAKDVQFIGCPAEDCANREGNVWLQGRVSGERLPKLKPQFIPSVSAAWVPPTDFKRALQTKTESQPTAYTFSLNKTHLCYILPLLGVMAIVTAVQIWFSSRPLDFFPDDSATLSLHMTHHSGYPFRDIANQPEAEPDLHHPTRLTLEINGETVMDETYPMEDEGLNQGTRVFEQIHLPTGDHHIVVTVYDRPDTSIKQVLFDGTVTLEPRQIFELKFKDIHYPDPEMGRLIYEEEVPGVNAGCQICHSLEKDVRIIGPSFYGVATRAETRIPGMSAEDYLHQSILDPNAYVVEGFPKGQMLQNFGKLLSEEQIDDLVAFLMTLK